MGYNVCQQTAWFLAGIDRNVAVLLIPGALLAMAYSATHAFRNDQEIIRNSPQSASHCWRDDAYIRKLTDRLLLQTTAVIIVLPFLALVACLSINSLTFCYMGPRGEMSEYPNALIQMHWALTPSYFIWAMCMYAWVQTLNEALGGDQQTWDLWKNRLYFILFPILPLGGWVYKRAYGVANKAVLRGAEHAGPGPQGCERIRCCHEH